MRALILIGGVLLAGVAAPAAAVPPQEAPQDDPTRTAGGALAAFMSLRHYLTIRELKAVMTPELQARYDHDSVPFNGRRTTRLAGFDFTERDLKPVVSSSREIRAAKGGDAQTAGVAQAAGGAPGGPAVYAATVQSLWEDQGEAAELRVESARVARREDGLWRVASLSLVRSEPLRFKDAIPGVTALRLLLRAWARGDLGAARGLMASPFLKRYEGHEADLRQLIVGGADPRHTAYQIVDMTPQGTASVVARVRLFETSPGRPSSLDGSVHTLRLVKKGPPWLLDAWD